MSYKKITTSTFLGICPETRMKVYLHKETSVPYPFVFLTIGREDGKSLWWRKRTWTEREETFWTCEKQAMRDFNLYRERSLLSWCQEGF